MECSGGDERRSAAPRHDPPPLLDELERLDVAAYAAVARTPTPSSTARWRSLSRAADYSKLSLGAAGLLSVAGGRRGRRAAALGLASVGVTATIVNVAVKPLGSRRRPDRVAQDVPIARHVPMPISTSFPSGHSGRRVRLRDRRRARRCRRPAVPLRALAALVAYSRVHTGVHYPGDVIAGSLIGGALAQATSVALDRRPRLGSIPG